MAVEIKTMRVVEETLEDSMETLTGDETIVFYMEIDSDIIDYIENEYPNSTDIAKLEEINKLFREDKIDMAVFSYAY